MEMKFSLVKENNIRVTPELLECFHIRLLVDSTCKLVGKRRDSEFMLRDIKLGTTLSEGMFKEVNKYVEI